MSTKCQFDASQFSFSGSALDQARCLLRFVKRGGEVGDTPASLPEILADLLHDPQALGITSAQLRLYLQKEGIAETTVGGSLSEGVSHADSNNPAAPSARYFVIHDTSTKLGAGQTFEPSLIDSPKWRGNQLSSLTRGKTHIYITRLGETLTDNPYTTPWRATQFELKTGPKPTRYRGLFLHHELVQPRMGAGKSDVDSPDPGFTQVQYERLALQYVIASVRRGGWMIPAFHCVIDLGVGDHDDPQHFDLEGWGQALRAIVSELRKHDFEAFASVIGADATKAVPSFRTPAAKSLTKDGKGGSATTGLKGHVYKPSPGVTIIDASETLSAFRNGHSLGPDRTVRQVRTTKAGATVIEQSAYCWGKRALPNAELVDESDGFGDQSETFEGKATFFGKSDTEDEGTGTPAFGTAQTNSSVFGISLRRARLISEGLVHQDDNGVVHATNKGLRAIVEVYFPDTKRLARLPLVDIGPGTSGGAKTAVADLTVAATAFLQKFAEKDLHKLENIQVLARIVA
jgi:hypothetical protein